MWKEQLQAMRVRARSEQRRAAELEGEVRRLGGSLADVTPANDFGSPEPAPQRRGHLRAILAYSHEGTHGC